MKISLKLAFLPWLDPRFRLLPLLLRATVAVALLWAASSQGAPGPSEQRRIFSNSITPMPPKLAATVRALRRENLTKTLEFEIPLQMRNYPKLLAKIGRGEVVPKDQMERDYLPLVSDYQKVIRWLRAQGFEITQTDPRRLSIFVRGTTAQIQQAFQVEMVQVTSEGTDYPAARTHPSLPQEIAGPVLGINGLQPYLHLHKHTLQPAPNISNQPPYTIKEVLGAYDAQNLGVTGTNQKIAILIDTVPYDSDLTGFWNFNNIPQSLSNIEKINVTGASLPSPTGEETLDVEWTSGIAPSAKIRVYASGSLSFTNLDKALQRIISDLPNQPQLHQLSISLGLGETYLLSSSQMLTDAQFFASIASSGVSIFVSSGDAGSNPDSSGQSSSGPLQVEYYASDPSVTGVGGTNLNLNATTGQVTSETGWAGSGGGVSQEFSRPSWQTGTGVVAGTKRLVPDVSSVASDSTYAYYYFGGKGSGVAGTSWSAPTWAGFCALMNEARANASQGPLGLLNPRIYPLLGTANFRDIVAGSNGQYSAGGGYDMVTGLGVPSVATLMQTLAGLGNGSPSVSAFAPTSGAVNTTVTVTGANLGRATAVSFNGTSASFTVDSSTQITATVPTGATTGPIAVTASPGGTATSANNFIVLSGSLANDNFANATTLTGTIGSLTATNIGATKEAGEPNHAGNAGGASVWYTWTAPRAGTYTFDTIGSSFDTLLGIYTGSSVSALTQVAANDDAGTGVTSSVSFVAAAGTVYKIAVDGHDGQTGTIQLHFTLNTSAPVINSFTPATGGVGTVVAINGANYSGATDVKFNGVSAIFDVVSSTQITATVPAGATTGILSVTTPAGSVNSSAVFTVIQSPDNDLFANAAALSGSSGNIAGSNVGATKESGEPNHAGNSGGASVWYSWTAPDSGPYSFDTFGSSFDTLLAVYTGSSVASLTPVVSNDDSGGGVASSVSFSAVAGTVYQIAVDGNLGATGNLVLSWNPSVSPPTVNLFSPTSGPEGASIVITGSHFIGATNVAFNGVPANFVVNSNTQITAVVPTGASNGPIQVSNLNGTGASPSAFVVTSTPLNDAFANRTILTGSGVTVAGSNVGATKEAGEPNHAGNAGGHSVWWSWTAPASGPYTISTLGSDFDTLLGVYTGTQLSNLLAVASNDDDPNGGVTSSVVLNAVAGTTYQIAVDGLNGASGNVILTIAPNVGTATLFSTQFETSEGYSTASPLGGQPASSSSKWQLQGSNGNGILSGRFAGMGQQAYLGYSRVNAQNTFVWKPINFTPGSGDTVTYSVTMQIVDSTNGQGLWDDFQWQVYNTNGQMLFAMDFDNSTLEVGYFLADNNYYSTGAYFDNSTKYTLQITFDFGNGTWKAYLNGKLLVSDAPLNNTSTAMALSLGDIDAVWAGSALNNYYVVGNNYMLFDNYSVTKTSLTAPQIVLQPKSQTANVGDNVSLSVAALGSQPISYQWQKNGVNIKGATAATLALSGVQSSDAGNYTVTVSNAASSALSGTAKLTVNTPPSSFSISTSSSPSNGGVTSGDGIYQSGSSATVQASANLGYQFVNWTENGNVVSGSSSYTFAALANRSLVANFQPVYYTILTDSSPVGTGFTIGSGTYQGGLTATLTATPAAGYQFASWTESGTAVSATASYQFTVTGDRQLLANFVADTTAPSVSIASPTSNSALTTISGTINLAGTASDNVGVTHVEWSNSLGGSGTALGTSFWSANGIALQTGTNVLTLTAYDAAGNSASATLQAIRIPPLNYQPFAGSYSGLLQASGSNEAFNGLAKFSVNSKGSVNGTIWFEHVASSLRGQLAPDGTYTAAIPRAHTTPLTVTLMADQTKPDQIAGTATDGVTVSSFMADRLVFNAASNPCPYAGKYTVVFPPDSNAAGSPQGTGYGIVSIGAAGNARLSGFLADGTPISQGANLSKGGLWPFFATAYGVAGAVAGPITMSGTSDLRGTVNWVKPIRLKDVYFPQGFQSQINVKGDRYKAPVSGTTVIPLGIRNLSIEASNIQLVKTVSLNPPSQLVVQNPGADRLSLKIVPSTGLISGKFLLNPLKSQWVTLRGIILQGEDQGAGFFLENGQSGEMDLGTAQ